jgi:hypothetical protein
VPHGNAPERRLISGTLVTVTERPYEAGNIDGTDFPAGIKYRAWMLTDAADPVEIGLASKEQADQLRAIPKGKLVYVVINAWPREDEDGRTLPPELKATSITSAD